MKKKNNDFSLMINGLNLQQELEITRDFLYWYELYLHKNEPHARNTIASINAVIDSLPEKIEEI